MQAFTLNTKACDTNAFGPICVLKIQFNEQCQKESFTLELLVSFYHFNHIEITKFA